MRLDHWLPTARLFLVRSIAAALMGISFAGCQISGAGYRPADPSVVRIPLSNSYDNKPLLRATVPGGSAWMALDTGAPITCADASKSALFHFTSFPQSAPSTVIVNGQRTRIAWIPRMEFGGVSVKNIPATLVDIASVIPPQQRGFCDGILGLGDLCRSHAVIDFGSHALFVHPQSARGTISSGWHAVPMTLVEKHLVVPVAINGIPASFIVDTGAPSSILDTAACHRQGIPVKKNSTFTMRAIHYPAKAGQLGMIHSLRLGDLDIGPTPVCVIDLAWLVNPQKLSPGAVGLIGAHTLERLKAIIDLDSMKLYIKQPYRPRMRLRHDD